MRCLLFLPLLLSAAGLQAQVFYGNGYTIVEGMDGRGMDLDTPVYKTISAPTIGSGLMQLLDGSGWALATEENADPAIWRLYSQPYPEYKRTLSPIALGQALQYLSGAAWDLVVDPVNRLISYEVNQRYRTVLAPLPATEPYIPVSEPVVTVGDLQLQTVPELTLADRRLGRTVLAATDTRSLREQRLASPLSKFSPGQSSSESVHSVQAVTVSGTQLQPEGFDMGIFLKNVQSKQAKGGRK